jgi:nitrogen fixation protein NifU and related proteins
MADLRELYQQVILDHNKKPRNFHEMPDCDHCAAGHNPLCGDRINVYLKIEAGVIKDISFEGNGCAISTASASMMTESLKGKTVAQAEELFKHFHHLLTEGEQAGEDSVPLGKLAAFTGVREFPIRVKCATLPWHTVHAALEKGKGDVSTE